MLNFIHPSPKKILQNIISTQLSLTVSALIFPVILVILNHCDACSPPTTKSLLLLQIFEE